MIAAPLRLNAFILRMAPGGIDRVSEALRSDEISMGWSRARGLTDPNLSWEHFCKIVHDQYYAHEPDFIRAGRAAGQLWRFIREMKAGDLVVVPQGRNFYVAKVIGDAYYDETTIETDTAHRRPVTWLNQRRPIPRALARAALQSRMKIQQSCASAGDLVDELMDALLSGPRGTNLPFEIDFRRRLTSQTLKEIRSGRLNEHKFEELIAALLRSLGASDVRIVPHDQDKGAQILGDFSIAAKFRVPLAVHVKHCRPVPAVDPHVIDELARGMEAEGVRLGWVVTSGEFSAAAVERAKEVQEQHGVEIELIDGEHLAAMIIESGLKLPAKPLTITDK